MQAKVTQLLSVLLIAACAVVLLGYWRLDEIRGQALSSQDDLKQCLTDEALLSGTGPGAAILGTADDPQLSNRLRAAAVDAGIPDGITSVDPNTPQPLRDTNYNETLVFIRINAVDLKQLTAFVHSLSEHDRNVRTKTIDLSLPGTPGAGPAVSASAKESGELWTADLTLAYLSYAPHGRKKS